MRLFKLHTLLITFLASFMMSANVFGSGKDTKPFTVVIDAGHGGKDYGATDNGAKEKEINLGVALQLENLLKKKLKDVKVVMTRKDDTYLTLQQRADIANKEKGDLFISIHTNSVDKSNKNRKTVAGSSVYALGLHKDESNMKVARRENSVIELESNYEQKYSGFDPNKDESYIIFEMAQKKNLSKSIRFAEAAQKELVNSGRKNRGVHQAGFWVLWATSMPAVLVELDFICNPTSAQFMTSSKGEKELAEALYNALKKYYDSWASASGKSLAKVQEEPSSDATISQESDDNLQIDEVESGEYAMKLLPSEKKKRTDVPAARKTQGNLNGQRKRRNETSKAISASRNVETALIPLHTEDERSASLVSMVAQEEKESLIPDVTQTEKDKKNSKKNKKEKKTKEKKEKKQRSANAHNAKREKFVKVYKIQILASADLLKQNNPRFCGFTPVSTYKENNLYKYYYGESTEKAEIDKLLIDVKKKIPDAFVVSATKSLGSDNK